MSPLTFQGYVQIAPYGNWCKKKGTNSPPRRCYKDIGDNVSRKHCEVMCDKFEWCLAYSHRNDYGHCWLFTVLTTCPSGWNYYNGGVITFLDELDGHPDSVYSGCYAKGKTKVELNVSCI